MIFGPKFDIFLHTVTRERPTIIHEPANLLIPKFTSTCNKIVTKSGKESYFTDNSIKAIKRFGKLLRLQADCYSLVWETIEIHGMRLGGGSAT